MRHVKITLQAAFLLAIPLVLSAPDAQAQWAENGAPVCTESDEQRFQDVCSDGDGGAIIVWQDNRTGEYDIYAQHVDAAGTPLWTPDGVPICAASSHQWMPQIISDGAGGAIITWYDARAANYDIYVQRITGDGTLLWTSGGVALCTDTAQQEYPRLVSDGSFGAIVTWQDDRGAAYDIYAQRVSDTGLALWTANGVSICSAVDNQYGPEIASDDDGGAIIAWRDVRGAVAGDVYAQRVSPNGDVYWTAGGVQVCTDTQDQEDVSIVADGSGGAIICWKDHRNPSTDIYAQKVNLSGSADWTTDGEQVCGDSGSQDDPKMVADGYGGAIIAWNDYRNGNWDVYAQRVDISGTVQWTTDGVAVSKAPRQQYFPSLVSDGAGGAIITWFDFRGGTYSDIYVQSVDASGSPIWQANGLPICMAVDDQSRAVIVSDREGGAIIVWDDKRAGLPGFYDVYAQRVTSQGYWGYPSPWIISVEDVPGDQGGKVRIVFGPSRLDSRPDLAIAHYSIWQALTAPEMIAMKSSGVSLAGPNQARPGLAGKAYYSASGWDWGLVGTVEAHLWPEYGYTAETLRDSTSVDSGWEYFCVSAHSDNYFDFWNSAPDSGYSVDNLSPAAPAPLAAEYLGGTELYIHWGPNTEEDLDHYAVYRGTTADFVPDETNLIGTPTDTALVDIGFGYGEYYYKVSAWDIHENESTFSLLTPEMISGTPGGDSHYDNLLFQNVPNPFPSSTRIAFTTEEEGHVRLSVFDARGRLVKVLVDAIRGPNRYVEQWDGRGGSGRLLPSGTYFYRLEAPCWTASKKMTLAR